MRITIPVEIGLDELIKELEECVACGDDISRMSKFKLLYLLKHLNLKEETKERCDEENPIDDLLDEDEGLEPTPKKTKLCTLCTYRFDPWANCEECRKNNFCHYEKDVRKK